MPLPSLTAEKTARAAVDHFFCRFGYPFKSSRTRAGLLSPSCFLNCAWHQMHKARTTPLRASSNGQVERFNLILMDAVRCYIRKAHNWNLYLQQTAGALRASVNRQTGYTANKLMLGREENTAAHLMFPKAHAKT